ncbi:MAG TPA: hypothetical protein VGI83_09820 [Gemmatimonadales bacterium]|jgi:hypothetical protein
MRARLLVSLLVTAVLACGGKQPPVSLQPLAAGPSCHVVLQTGPARDTVFVGVADAVDSAHAPVAITDAERFVFGALYDKPGRKDCNGRILAVSPASYRPDSWTSSRIVAVPASGRGPVIVYLVTAGGDSRDLLDRGADLVITDDPATLEYAARRDIYEVAALPWTWTYVLVGPPPVPDSALTTLDSLLAAGAVHGDVRAVQQPRRWSSLPPCGSPEPAPRAGGRRIAFVATDPVARDLAGRLVSLAATGRAFAGQSVTALPLPDTLFDAAFAVRAELGYITTLPANGPENCVPSADWGRITPLVDARAHVIARRGVIGVDVDADGTPYLVTGQ